MKLRKAYSEYDAELIYAELLEKEAQKKQPQPTDCRCGEVLRGLIDPKDCPLFGKSCAPQNPIGPCMVSYEGSCNIEYKYRKT